MTTHRMGDSGQGNAAGNAQDMQVIDFSEVRAQKMNEKRRKTQRVFYRNLLSVYSMVGESAMFPIELIDVSEEGCSFQIPYDPEKPWPADAREYIPIRLYFTQDTYLEIKVQIQYSRPAIENHSRYVRFGCSVDKASASYSAYQQFVRFLELYSEHARKDLGGISVFYL